MKKTSYDKAFKEHAVNLWLGSGKSAREVAAELGVKPDRLYTWKEALEPAPTGGKGGAGSRGRNAKELELELARLERENHMLRQQRDILKKPWASSPNPRPTLPTDPSDEIGLSHSLPLPGPGSLG